MVSATQVRKDLGKTSRLIGELGHLLRRRKVLAARRDERIQKIKDFYDPQTEALTAQINDKVEELLAHALPRAVHLRYAKTQSIRTLNGVIKWRRSTAVEYKNDDKKAIIKRIQRKGWTRKLLRRGEYTIDKTAVVKYPELAARIKGLQVVERVTFTFAPSKGDVSPYQHEVDSIKVTLPDDKED